MKWEITFTTTGARFERNLAIVHSLPGVEQIGTRPVADLAAAGEAATGRGMSGRQPPGAAEGAVLERLQEGPLTIEGIGDVLRDVGSKHQRTKVASLLVKKKLIRRVRGGNYVLLRKRSHG